MIPYSWPDALGAAIGAFAVYPWLARCYGSAKVTDALMLRFDRTDRPGEFAGIGLMLYGMLICAVFGLLILGLGIRVLVYGMERGPLPL